MRAALAALLLALGAPARAQDDDPLRLQRYLQGLHLGDFLREVKLVYPPLRDWTTFRAPGGQVTHVEIHRIDAKSFPRELETLKLGFRWGELASIQAIYSEEAARLQPLEKLVVEYSTLYGEPTRKGETYTWKDRRTELRLFNAQLASAGERAVELRPAVEIRDAGLREREPPPAREPGD